MNDLSINRDKPATILASVRTTTAPVREFVGMRNAIAISAVMWVLIWVLMVRPLLG
jgi:hypothetical protein